MSAQLENGGSLEYAQGYEKGWLARVGGKAPAIYVMVGIDDYCLGFRAGYFSNVRNLSNTNASDRVGKIVGHATAPPSQTA